MKTNMESFNRNDEETMDKKRITVGDIKPLFILYATLYTLLDRDENEIDDVSVSSSGYDTMDDIPVKRIYSNGKALCIVLDYKPDIINELGIQDTDVQLSSMLAILIKSKQRIEVVETMNKSECTGNTIFSINKDGELNYSSYFEYMLTKFGETAEDTAKAKAIREGVKDKVKEVMSYNVNNVEARKDEFTDIIYYVVYISKD
jgi:hypothetical protein